MNVAIFGATGKLGQSLLPKLLARGHSVRALARSPNHVAPAHPALSVVQGDMRDYSAVANTVAGQEAVINAVGGEGDIRQVAIANIIAAMKQAKVTRLINLGGAGILQIGPLLLYQLPVFPAAMRGVTNEHFNVYEALRRSELAWTMVCPPFMTAGPGSGRYKVKADNVFFPPARSMALADVADFIVDELGESRFVHKRVAIK